MLQKFNTLRIVAQAAIIGAMGFLSGCNSQPRTGITVNMQVAAGVPDTLYLFRVIDEHYGTCQLTDTLLVQNGRLERSWPEYRSQLFVLSQRGGRALLEELLTTGCRLYLASGKNSMQVFTDNEGKLCVEGAPTSLQSQLERFTSGMHEATHSAEKDSLERAFYAARDANDSMAMVAINRRYSELEDELSSASDRWIFDQLDAAGRTEFGLYLYYTYIFTTETFTQRAAIDSVRTLVGQYDAGAQASDYAYRIATALDQMAGSAIGAVAPGVTGRDSVGNAVTLESLRGQWVLVDFWASSCGWCRRETPNIVEVYKAYRSRNFQVLGVSSDHDARRWKKALAEDGCVGVQILLAREDIDSVMNAYYITGIPQILLVDPEGKIVARNLRGEAIGATVGKFLGAE